jgi:hypothetical protein
MIFYGQQVHCHLNGGIENLGHKDQGYGNAQGYQLNALQLKIYAQQKGRDSQQKNYAHIAVE